MFECVSEPNSWGCDIFRMSVPHGWLVTTGRGGMSGITFYPDEKHEWRI